MENGIMWLLLSKEVKEEIKKMVSEYVDTKRKYEKSIVKKEAFGNDLLIKYEKLKNKLENK